MCHKYLALTSVTSGTWSTSSSRGIAFEILIMGPSQGLMAPTHPRETVLWGKMIQHNGEFKRCEQGSTDIICQSTAPVAINIHLKVRTSRRIAPSCAPDLLWNHDDYEHGTPVCQRVHSVTCYTDTASAYSQTGSHKLAKPLGICRGITPAA